MDYAHSQLLPACDFCYAKKSRCDRREPCGNCVTARVQCLRNRPRHGSQNKKGDRIDAVLERMSRLEESLREPGTRSSKSDPPLIDLRASLPPSDKSNAPSHSSTTAPEQAATGTIASHLEGRHAPALQHNGHQQKLQEPRQPRKRPAEYDLDGQQQRRRALSRASEPRDELGQSPQDRMLASLDLQRYLLSSKRESRAVDADRQAVLEAAIAVAKQVTGEATMETDCHCRSNLYDPSMYPTAEFVHFILHDVSRSGPMSYFLRIFSCNNPPSVEQMALDLINCSVHGQKRAQYLICVNHMAYAYLTSSESERSPAMALELQRSKKRYRDNVRTALDYLDTKPRADVTLLFALQCAAMLMQDIGDMRHCWKLNTQSCLVGAMLKGKPMGEIGITTSEDLTTMRLACIRAYVFDMALSANMYQSACIAPMDIDRTVLDTEKPADAMLYVLLSFAQVQEVIVWETRKCAAPEPTQRRPQMDTEKLASLVARMKVIRSQVEEFQHKPGSAGDDYLQFEWRSLDFIFYSVMTTITRLSATGENSHLQHQCLENARRCLFTLKDMLEMQSNTANPVRYLSSLTWIVPLFSLRPLYFVFSNIIETSDALDLKILQDITRGLSELGDSVSCIRQVQQLCTSFLDLYTDFVERMYSRRSQGVRPWALPHVTNQDRFNNELSSSIPLVPALSADAVTIDSPSDQFQDDQMGLIMSSDFSQQRSIDMSLFDNQVNWELFYSQQQLDLPT